MLIFTSGISIEHGSFSCGQAINLIDSFVGALSGLVIFQLHNGEYKHEVDYVISNALQQNDTFCEYYEVHTATHVVF